MLPSRRDFVAQALALAATALSRGATAEPASAPPPAHGADDGRIRVAVIGVNGQGSAHVRALLTIPAVDLVAVCDCDPGAYLRLVQDTFSAADAPAVPDYMTDVRRLLDRRDIDAVTIATPNHWHALMAVWAMQAGKDVYVEKPCSHTVHEGRVITSWARKLGRICQMGAQSRSMSGMRQAIDFVRGGSLGPVRVAHALCFKRRPSIGWVDSPAPLPPGLDFDLWAGPAPKVVPVRRRLHYDWHWTRLTGNGDLGNQNPHELDKARWGLGKRELPRRVVSLGGRLGYVDNGDAANSQVTIYHWDDAVLVSDVRGLEIKSPVDFGLHAGPLRVGNIWWGTEGYVVAPANDRAVAFDYDGHELGKWSGGEFRDHFVNFLDAVRSRRREDLHLDIEDGHLSSALAHLGNVSWALGEPVEPGTRANLGADDPRVQATWESFEQHLAGQEIDYRATKLLLGRELAIDPHTERTTDDAANAHFTREYRRGFELPEA
jgi:predicted dehydrogenase